MENQKLSLTEIKKRAIKSFVSLISRQIILRAISFVALNIIGARFLPVETLGIFNIATAIIVFFAYFSDIGLAASLIQKKEDIKHGDIKTTFTIQLLIVGFLSLLIILAAPIFANFYHLNDAGIWLIRVLGASFFLSSLKVVPSVLLERQLNFQPLVIVEVIEVLLFNFLWIFFVMRGLDLWAFSIAAFSRGVVGVILIYLMAPVKVGVGIEKESAKKLLSFGIPFQTNSLLALVKDRLVPLVVAGMVGPIGIGYITWSQSIAFAPFDIMNVVIRITFPAFSRLQEDKQSLEKAVEKSLFVTTLTVYPLIFGLLAVLPPMVSYIVSSKWQPAVLSFYLFAFSAIFSVISTTLTNVLNAVGKIKTTLKLMIFWTVLTWVLTPALVHFYGFIGVSVTSLIISFTAVTTIILVKRILTISLIDSIALPLISSIIMAVAVFFIAQNFVRDLASLAVAILIGGFIYILLILLFGRDKVLDDLKDIKRG